MTLVVETGAGLANAESYASVAQFQTRCAALGRTDAAAMVTGDVEVALRKATDYMTDCYRTAWLGYRTSTTQALDWPRYQVPRHDAIGGSYGSPPYYDTNVIPVEIVNACVDLAYKTATGTELEPDIDRVEKMIKVGPITVEYDPRSPDATTFRAIANKLAPFLGNSAGGMTRRLVRT